LGQNFSKVTWTWGEGPEGRQKCGLKQGGVTHWERQAAGVPKFKEEKAEMGTQGS